MAIFWQILFVLLLTGFCSGTCTNSDVPSFTSTLSFDVSGVNSIVASNGLGSIKTIQVSGSVSNTITFSALNYATTDTYIPRATYDNGVLTVDVIIQPSSASSPSSQLSYFSMITMIMISFLGLMDHRSLAFLMVVVVCSTMAFDVDAQCSNQVDLVISIPSSIDASTSYQQSSIEIQLLSVPLSRFSFTSAGTTFEGPIFVGQSSVMEAFQCNIVDVQTKQGCNTQNILLQGNNEIILYGYYDTTYRSYSLVLSHSIFPTGQNNSALTLGLYEFDNLNSDILFIPAGTASSIFDTATPTTNGSVTIYTLVPISGGSSPFALSGSGFSNVASYFATLQGYNTTLKVIASDGSFQRFPISGGPINIDGFLFDTVNGTITISNNIPSSRPDPISRLARLVDSSDLLEQRNNQYATRANPVQFNTGNSTVTVSSFNSSGFGYYLNGNNFTVDIPHIRVVEDFNNGRTRFAEFYLSYGYDPSSLVSYFFDSNSTVYQGPTYFVCNSNGSIVVAKVRDVNLLSFSQTNFIHFGWALDYYSQVGPVNRDFINYLYTTGKKIVKYVDLISSAHANAGAGGSVSRNCYPTSKGSATTTTVVYGQWSQTTTSAPETGVDCRWTANGYVSASASIEN